MACQGDCDFKRYAFDKGDKTVVTPSRGAPALERGDLKNILDDYFESILTTECKTCTQPADPADKCVCVPTDPIWISTHWKSIALPEPIVATSGANSYTITGDVRLFAHILKGTCRDQKDLPKTPAPPQPKFKIAKKFRAKKGSACGCNCEKRFYVFKKTDKTKVAPKGSKAKPLALTGDLLDDWISARLRDYYGRPGGEYEDKDIVACDNDCECLQMGEDTDPPQTAKIGKAVQAVEGNDLYLITGEFEVVSTTIRGVCVPKTLELESAQPGRDEGSGR